MTDKNVSAIILIMKALTSITTMQDLADAAGVSLATVSRVFSGSNKVSDKTKEKVMELVKQSGFCPNETARTMAAGKSRLIAVILPDIENPFFSKLLSEVEEKCVESGYSMIFFNSKGDSEKEKDIVTKMMARQADGMLICMTKVKSEMIPVLKTAKYPVVVMARNIEGLNSVGIDHVDGGRLAADYLLENQCKSFFYFGLTEDEKFIGFNKELLAKGIQEKDIHAFADKNWYYSELNEAAEIMDKFMQENVKSSKAGLFCVNDLFALQAISAAHRNNIDVPGQLSIIGFDNINVCDLSYPTLSSISQPMDKIASESFRLLMEKINEKEGNGSVENIVLQPSLIKRDS